MRGEEVDEAGIEIPLLRVREPKAVERWFLAYADSLYTFVFYRVGKDQNVAADVVQDTFTAALEEIHGYDPRRGPMFTWLRLFAKNRIRRALLQKRRYSQCLDRWEAVDRELARAFERIDDAPLAEELLEQKETAELVQMALSNMPFKYSRLLKKHYCQRQPLKQIAESDGTTEGAIKALLHRARLAFKTTFITLGRNCLPATRGSAP